MVGSAKRPVTNQIAYLVTFARARPVAFGGGWMVADRLRVTDVDGPDSALFAALDRKAVKDHEHPGSPSTTWTFAFCEPLHRSK